MTIEEKAKAYDEALERAKEQLEGAKVFDYKEGQIAHDIRTTTYAIFPELKESGEDKNKRISKEITQFLKQNNGWNREWLTWLEKQAEKPTNKIEPKFQNGQWIVWQNKCYKVNDSGCGYELIGQDGLSISLEYGTVDEDAHLLEYPRCKGR